MAHPLILPKFKEWDANGNPLAGGKLYSYVAGTSTPLATYTDSSGATPNTNPVILDSSGRAEIWIGTASYKFTLTDSNDNVIWTEDNVSDLDDSSVITAKIADSAVTTNKLADASITKPKFGSGVLGNVDYVEVTEDLTLTINHHVVLVNAIAGDIDINLPNTSGIDKKSYLVKRIDGTGIKSNAFIDANVTVASNTINISSHSFIDTQRVQLTTDGVLPTGTSLLTNYYIIKVDDDNVQLASSKANAEADIAVNISSAAGGGVHTITSQYNEVRLVPYSIGQTIDENTYLYLDHKNDYEEIFNNGSKWYKISSSRQKINKIVSESSSTESITATSLTQVTNLIETISCNGLRPVKIKLIPDGNGSSQIYTVNNSTSNRCTFVIKRDGTAIAYFYQGQTNNDGSDNKTTYIPISTIQFEDEPSRGEHTYSVEASVLSGGQVNIHYCKLLLREL